MDIAEKFQRWYEHPIATLVNNPDAGFAVLTLALPILERYVRRKAKITQHQLPDNSPFFDELLRLVPEFKSRVNVINFWRFYRHGLLHQATLNGEFTFLKDDGPLVTCWQDRYGVSPKRFARLVLSIVGNDLSTFEDPTGPKPNISTVQETAGRSGVFRP